VAGPPTLVRRAEKKEEGEASNGNYGKDRRKTWGGYSKKKREISLRPRSPCTNNIGGRKEKTNLFLESA